MGRIERKQKIMESNRELTNIFEEVSNETTPPKRLEEIYNNYPQDEVRKILSSNPNTPWKLLEKLGEKFPEQLLANPILDL